MVWKSKRIKEKHQVDYIAPKIGKILEELEINIKILVSMDAARDARFVRKLFS